MPLRSPKDELILAIRGLSFAGAQNKLMAITDREIALSMMYMQDSERNYVLSFLSLRKQEKVKEELQLHQRLCIKYSQYLTAIRLVILKLKTVPTKYNLPSYIRPRGRAD